MNYSFPRPAEKTVSVERAPAEGSCPACGSEALQAYPVLSEGGWWDVVKCQQCLASIERRRGPLLGPYTPLGAAAIESDSGKGA
jgi:hypothetical protein